MAIHRIVFTTTTTSELKFADSDVTHDATITTVWQNGEKVFSLPTAHLVAVERLVPPPAVDVPTD